jgi:SAM-dependent methyltransferase
LIQFSNRGRFDVVRDILVPLAHPGARLLDIGCRDGILRRHLPPGISWVGADLFQNEEGSVTHVGDLTAGLPVADQSFDFVTALDVIEHTDDMLASLGECWRITGKALIVALPNMAHLVHRLRFFSSGRLGAKYDVGPEPMVDRHRWVTIQPQCDAMMRAFAERAGAELTIVHQANGRRLTPFAVLGRKAGLPAALWTFMMYYKLTRRAA